MKYQIMQNQDMRAGIIVSIGPGIIIWGWDLEQHQW